MDIVKQISIEFNLNERQVRNTVELIDADNTIPFIARYRKEHTGGLDDTTLRGLYERLMYLRQIEKRKAEVIRLIDEQGKLTDELAASINACDKLIDIEDIYAKYKPKRRTRAMIAKERGLEPLSDIIIAQQDCDLIEAALSYINEELGVTTAEEAINGALDIIAENIADTAEIKGHIRTQTYNTGVLQVSKVKAEDIDDKNNVYEMYYDFTMPLGKLPNHRVLAINRGIKDGVLTSSLKPDEGEITAYLYGKLIKSGNHTQYIMQAAADSYKRLIAPSVENELMNMSIDAAGEAAITLFSSNLRQLLMQPPIKDMVVMGVDPGYRTGCKVAVVNQTGGKVLATAVIYPTPPHNKIEQAKEVVSDLIEKHKVRVISIGNGTASRETELFIADVLKRFKGKVRYTITNEAGASVYSASQLASDEFPELDVAERSAVSIARRLIDPLSELIKIEPRSIGVGQYQHDLNQKRLSEALGGVVEACVNAVGVDVNTASAPLLSYVAGINKTVASNIIDYREQVGRIKTRKELEKVKKLGSKTFTQCAGFLRIRDADDILDTTGVHPESYAAALELLRLCDYTIDDVRRGSLHDLEKRANALGIEEVAKCCNVGVPTLTDIIAELKKPGRDVRDSLPPLPLKSEVMTLEELSIGSVMQGTVRNITDFGAFIDIGVHQDGLCHISELSDKFISHPMDAVSVGDVVTVRVLDVDIPRKRISLTCKKIMG